MASCRVTEGRIENTTDRVRPLRVAARRQRELLCVMTFQEMEWALINEVDTEDFDLSKIIDDENENEFGTPVFVLMKSFQSDLMKVRTECIDIVLLVKYQP